MKGDDIEERLIAFAIRIINLSDNLPSSRAGNHIAGQILRSGTAPAAHYAEARSAESKKDFIHKLKIGLKEMNETRIWLRILMGSNLMVENKLQNLHDECQSLCRILSSSITTTKKNT